MDGAVLEAGDELTEGSVNPHDLLKIKGIRAVQDYMLREVQRVYRLQGVDIADKHIEVIVRQMLKKVRIENNGDADFLPGTLVDALEYEETNERLLAEGKEPADGKQVMLGITKAAIKGKVDPLIGLKENVILGKLIPAGTGMKRYRNVTLNSDERIAREKELALEAAYEEENDVAESFVEELEAEIERLEAAEDEE